MRFRFGWRKEQKSSRHINEILNEYVELDTAEDLPSQEIISPARIIFFGDHEEISSLYRLLLQSKGYEVLHFSSPSACPLISKQKNRCPRHHVCADLMMADMDMEGMTGLELFRHQKERGCRAITKHKAVISKSLTSDQEREAEALGCKTLRKPFRLIDMMEWVKQCEQEISPDRKLIPRKELPETA